MSINNNIGADDENVVILETATAKAYIWQLHELVFLRTRVDKAPGDYVSYIFGTAKQIEDSVADFIADPSLEECGSDVGVKGLREWGMHQIATALCKREFVVDVAFTVKTTATRYAAIPVGEIISALEQRLADLKESPDPEAFGEVYAVKPTN